MGKTFKIILFFNLCDIFLENLIIRNDYLSAQRVRNTINIISFTFDMLING